jgi:hypothetical protein
MNVESGTWKVVVNSEISREGKNHSLLSTFDFQKNGRFS